MGFMVFCSYIHVVNAGFFLFLMRTIPQMSEHGERVDLESIRRKVELESKYVLVFWPSRYI